MTPNTSESVKQFIKDRPRKKYDTGTAITPSEMKRGDYVGVFLDYPCEDRQSFRGWVLQPVDCDGEVWLAFGTKGHSLYVPVANGTVEDEGWFDKYNGAAVSIYRFNDPAPPPPELGALGEDRDGNRYIALENGWTLTHFHAGRDVVVFPFSKTQIKAISE